MVHAEVLKIGQRPKVLTVTTRACHGAAITEAAARKQAVAILAASTAFVLLNLSCATFASVHMSLLSTNRHDPSFLQPRDDNYFDIKLSDGA